MKRFTLVFCIIVFTTTMTQAQSGFSAGASLGLPVGDTEEISKLQVGAHLAYLLPVADMLFVGPKTGYSRFFMDGKDFRGVDLDDLDFIPIAASGRVSLAKGLFFGTDLGYALGLNDGNDGGFYYNSQIGYNFQLIGATISYTGISADGGSLSSVNLGIEFGL